MREAKRVRVSAGAAVVLAGSSLIAFALLFSAHRDYPHVHTSLDTSAALLSALLAALLWEMGSRFAHLFPRWLSLSFAVTALLELVHVLVTVEWFGALAHIADAADDLRPATYPPAQYVLPIGILIAMLLWRRRGTRAAWFGAAMLGLGIGLMVVFNQLPRYTPPTLLGITRPLLVGVPVLWSGVAAATWRARHDFRFAGVLCVAALLMVFTQTAMLYSTAPDDTQAIISHLGKVGAYLSVLWTLMSHAAIDMAGLAAAEHRLAETNLLLEQRVTERTEQLSASEQRFRALIENSADGIALVASDGGVSYRSPAASRLLGRADSDPPDASFLNRVHPEDQERMRGEFAQVRATPGMVRRSQARGRHEDGTWRTLEIGATNLLDHPHVRAVVVNFSDVTARIDAEREARASAERFQEMAAHIQEAFFVVDLATGATLYVSPNWAEIWGRPIAEGYHPEVWINAIHEDDRSLLVASQDAVRAGRSDDTTFRVIRPNGATRWVRGRAYPVRDETGTVARMVGVTEDITDLRSAEERFTQAQKMEAIGRLAGGVAHDFNNLLTVIMAETELVQSTQPRESENWELLREVISASDSAVNLTRQLLAFSRKQLVEPVVFPLNDVVAETSKLLRRLIGEDVRLELRLRAESGSVRADRGQVEQVLTNLAVNARDAMPSGGALVIETALVELDTAYVATRPEVTPGEYATLIVSDTGTGMTEGVLAHAFEPFFTTKPRGHGTGLGLATCHGIIRQAGGHIAIYSELGVGTTFRVYLPCVDALPDVRGPATLQAPGGSETILFVEDEPGVRRVGARMLRDLGYEVLEARDAVEALSLLNAHPALVDLLFTDVVLPAMGGRELAERVQLLRPSIKVLFASGYTDDVILQHQLIAHDVSILTKPYTRGSVAQKIRSVLDS